MCHGNRSLLESNAQETFSQYDIDMNEYMELSNEAFGDFNESSAENNQTNSIQ